MTTAVSRIRTDTTISCRHSVGLRRDVLRQIADCESKAERWHLNAKTFLSSKLQGRELTSFNKRTTESMRKEFRNFRREQTATALFCSATSLLTRRIEPNEDFCEDQVFLLTHKYSVSHEGAQLNRMVTGCVGPHAIERYFQRTGSRDIKDAVNALDEAANWLQVLTPALATLNRGRRLRQIVAPTKFGAFLGQISSDGTHVYIRTWVATGGNYRIDSTIAAFKSWSATPSKDPNSLFRQLVGRSDMRWLMSEYQQ